MGFSGALEVDVSEQRAGRARRALELRRAEPRGPLGVDRDGVEPAEELALRPARPAAVRAPQREVGELDRAAHREAVQARARDVVDVVRVVAQRRGDGQGDAAGDGVDRDDVEPDLRARRQAAEARRHEPDERPGGVDALVPAGEGVARRALDDGWAHRRRDHVTAGREAVLGQRLGVRVGVRPPERRGPRRDARRARGGGVVVDDGRAKRRELLRGAEAHAVWRDADLERLGHLPEDPPCDERRRAVHIAPAGRARREVREVHGAVDIDPQRSDGVGLEVREPREVHDGVDVGEEGARLRLGPPAERLGELSLDDADASRDVSPSLRSEPLAQRAKRGRALDDAIEASLRGHVPRRADEHGDPAELGEVVEERREPHLAQEARHSRQQEVLPREGRTHGRGPHARHLSAHPERRRGSRPASRGRARDDGAARLG